MKEYLQSHTVETPAGFIVREIKTINNSNITFTVSLPPYELGVLQESILLIISSGKDKYDFTLQLKLLQGDRDMWIRSNYRFIDAIRKQLLIWRTLASQERKRYETS
jgi:hypothetical protein